MSYKINLQNPTRRAIILNRRKKYSRSPTLGFYTDFIRSRYIPGNGPNHKLGRKDTK